MQCRGTTCGVGIIVLFLIFSRSIAEAGSWALPAGSGQIISTSRYSQADSLLLTMGEEDTNVTFSKSESEVFWEHGLTPKLTLVGKSVFQTVNYLSSAGQDVYVGFGGSQLGTRYQVYKKGKTVFSLQPSFIISGGGESIVDADLGRRLNAFEIRALFGYSGKIAGKPAFIDVQLATELRKSQDGGSYRTEITGGYSFSKKGQILIQGFHNKTFRQDGMEDMILATKSLKLQASYVHKLKRGRSLYTGVFQTVAGENIVKENGFIIGLWQHY